MSDSISERITRTIVRNRKKLLAVFVVAWIVLLVALLGLGGYIFFRDQDADRLSSRNETLTLHVIYLSYLIFTQLAMVMGYLMWVKDGTYARLTVFLTVMAVLGFVPAFIILFWSVPAASVG